MRDRKLGREEALGEYIVYRLRTYEFLHIFQVVMDIIAGTYKPQNALGHDPHEFVGSLRTATVGLFASFVDAQANALDVFDVWRVLFPEKEARIVETWKKVEPVMQTIRDYRNDVAFHANKNLRRYFDTRSRFLEQKQEIVAAMQDFFGLAAELLKAEETALPDFRSEVEATLKESLPRLGEDGLKKLTAYFVDVQTGD